MSAMRHLRKQSLSVSLPDVSCDVGSSHDFLPMPPISSSPSRAAATNYKYLTQLYTVYCALVLHACCEPVHCMLVVIV